MPPTDPDDALGRTPSGVGDDLADLLVGRIGRALRAENPGPLVEPPAEIWAAISAAVAAESVSKGQARRTEGGHGSVGAVPRQRRTARRGRRVLVGVLASVVAAAVAAAILLPAFERSSSRVERLLAAGTLQPLAPGAQGSGRAVVRAVAGESRLELQLAELDDAPTGSFYELWIIDPGVTKLISLGPVRADGIYIVPSGVQLADFPVVDVSIEPIDGNTAHSGDSVLRGTLNT